MPGVLGNVWGEGRMGASGDDDDDDDGSSRSTL